MPLLMVSLAVTLFLSLSASVSHADPFYSPPAPDEEDPHFSGDIELGYTRLSGNTNSQSLISKGTLTWLKERWTHSLRGEIRNVSRDDETSAEQYLAAWRERYDFNGPHYLFGFTRWEKDRFSGYDQQLAAIGGYGRQVLDNEAHKLSLEMGPGYRRDTLADNHSVENQAVAYGALDYEWDFSSTASLSQEFSMEGTQDNVTTRSLSALTAKLNSRLALRLSHEIKRNSQPPEETDSRRDMTTSASILYSWE
ncbi:DUF481 domain-containing protein [Aidingimonas halophila]|uniref:Putative salt-induced outer membrane protein n=1 Tax=Aidingimonas halophila TaxID=574349 RepID=A0A1H2VE66_9GAMM|nr:DUF481 domain-containing protein [Aidingimonas halophila]GHC24175.1 membrane protein [Aidingimonas halophila]SDW66592.1 putative salt-induced outer membrane protein [Aidingimonas halophila]